MSILIFGHKNNRMVHFSILALFLISIIIPSVSILNSKSVGAVSLSDWDPGLIMDDAVMGWKNTMTASQIQTFLNSKVPVCDTYGQQLSEFGGPDLNSDGKVQRWEWGKAYYNQTVFTCLKNYKENNISAAQIIYNVAQKYSINPQVLLVLLQKEQALITDTWPLNNQYLHATGYGCPDDGDCDIKYYGFTNQLDNAARHFNGFIYGDYTSQYSPGLRYVLYNKLVSCGGSYINIKNRATQALYTYTPYQPNQATLDAVWGTATCGAYGNRNFYLYFTTWFGSTKDTNIYKFENLVGKEPSIIINNSLMAGSPMASLSNEKEIRTFYFDGANSNLRQVQWKGTSWTDTIIDGNGSKIIGSNNAGITVNSINSFYYDENIQLYYNDGTTGQLKHLFAKNGELIIEVLDGNLNSVLKKDRDVGSAISGFEYNGDIQLYYYDKSNGDLIHTWWSRIDRKWSTEVLDGNLNSVLKKDRDVGSAISSIQLKNDVQLFYYDKNAGELIHTWWSSDRRRWLSEIMDGSKDSVLGNYINSGKIIKSQIFQDDLYVLYYDESFTTETTSAWRLVYWNGDGWIQNILDGGTSSGKSGSSEPIPVGDLGITNYYNKSLQIFYKSSAGYLKHAWITK